MSLDMSTIESITFSSDNGSVPDPYYKGYELTFYKEGKANLVVFSGREANRLVALDETNNLDPDVIRRITSLIEVYKPALNKVAEVGGSIKTIIIHSANTSQHIEVKPNDLQGVNLFKKCLSFYDPHIETRLE